MHYLLIVAENWGWTLDIQPNYASA